MVTKSTTKLYWEESRLMDEETIVGIIEDKDGMFQTRLLIRDSFFSNRETGMKYLQDIGEYIIKTRKKLLQAIINGKVIVDKEKEDD